MIRYRYEPRKATEAACYMLKLAGGEMNYTVLIKLLYLADRAALDRWGSTITTDNVVSMDNGLVLSNILNHVKDDEFHRHLRKYWGHYISKRSRQYFVRLLRSPDFGELSVRELKLLKEIHDELAHLGLGSLIKLHHELPEYIEAHGSSVPISLDELLVKLHKSVHEIEAVTEDAEIQNIHQRVRTPQA